jgi:hypothetical protein
LIWSRNIRQYEKTLLAKTSLRVFSQKGITIMD